jgi:uncharacterized protein YsxB (DUF464 family)
MIDIYLTQKNIRYGIKAVGHADYAPKGQDIVCAGVSTLIQAYGNYIELLAKFDKVRVVEVKLDDGDINVDAVDIKHNIKHMYRMVIEGLCDLATMYPENIKMHFNENN